MHVVIVESPAKAKTINKYLGDRYVVLASYGHVRDLPAKDGSVRPERDFEMDYEADPKSAKQLAAIAQALRGAESLILATDPDREGEAISWHVLEALKERRRIGADVPVHRVVFNEITRNAVLQAMEQPRELDMDLVNAQQARRALDYLVGFTLSPVLWRKLPGARSAGRVQSVALRLICEREMEIEAFRAQEYWSVEADFSTDAGAQVTARLTVLDGRKLEKFSLGREQDARQAVAAVEAGRFRVAQVETKPGRRHPQPPFTTSTLQQEASRKLGFAAKRTMQIAQRLYEGIEIGGETVGLITYMRTDGVQMAQEAIHAARDVIRERHGDVFVPERPRAYQTKAKNAQEAHEAIRPTDMRRHPDEVRRYLDEEQRRLYDLVWKRAVASQMESARVARTTVDILSQDDRTGLRATGTVIEFPGFLALYQEGRDEPVGDDDAERRLPLLLEGTALATGAIRPEQHFTEPPPRFSEATLVKRLEELGIGRPSTYASIISVLQDRNYVRLEKNRFVPEDKGRLVTAFLVEFFRRYFDYDFTARLEERLDEITDRQVDWKTVLHEFWQTFSRYQDEPPGGPMLSVEEAVKVLDETIGTRQVVIQAIDEALGPHFFPAREDGGDARACPACSAGRLGIRFGRNGGFIGCSRYPECRYTRPLATGGEAEDGQAALEGPVELGTDPETGLAVTLRKGPYGLYLQLGEADNGAKPKRVGLPRDVPVDTVDLALALRLLRLPRTVGPHPDSGEPILAGLGRYGPYLSCDGRYAKLQSTEEVLEIGHNAAVDRLAQAAQRGGGGQRGGVKPVRVIGEHPEQGGEIGLYQGRYGPYVKHGSVNATLPKGSDPDALSVAEAVALISARAGKAPARPAARGARAKAPSGGKAAAGAVKSRQKTAAAKAEAGEAKATKARTGSKAKATAVRATPGKAATAKASTAKASTAKTAAGKAATGGKAAARKPATRTPARSGGKSTT